MVRGHEDRGSIADIAGDLRNIQQVVLGGVAGCEQILLGKDVVVVVWPMS